MTYHVFWLFPTTVSSHAVRLSLPDDGMPTLEDWTTVWEVFTFTGINLTAEPLQLNAALLVVLTCARFVVTHKNKIC